MALFLGACHDTPADTSGPTCTDGVQNGTETAVDCGGDGCSSCASGETCQVDGDCLSGHCDAQGLCGCPEGYVETVDGGCENVDDCAPNPCQNGGTCTDGVNAYTCACAEGYWGTTCERACAQGSCTGTVTCDTTTGEVTSCSGCEAGTWGTTCDPACTLDPCDQATGTATSCAGCEAGSWGPACGQTCDPGHCWGTVSCDQDSGALFACAACTDGYPGPTCGCGDGVLDTAAGEACDDGNHADGDGCSATCAEEPAAAVTDLGAGPLLADSSRTCADIVSYSVTGLAGTSATVTPSPTPDCLAAGDEVLLLDAQGSAGAVDNVGNYELLTVAGVSGDTVSFSQTRTRSYGAAAGSDAGVGTGASDQKVIL